MERDKIEITVGKQEGASTGVEHQRWMQYYVIELNKISHQHQWIHLHTSSTSRDNYCFFPRWDMWAAHTTEKTFVVKVELISWTPSAAPGRTTPTSLARLLGRVHWT